jgi:amino acid permease
MAKNVKKMKPIWYFVGLVLLFIGVVIFLTGIYDLIAGSESKTVLAHLHPNIWWGRIMVIAGLIFVLVNKNATVE